jgi:hypothetical protein
LNNISHPIPAMSTTEITIPGRGPYRDLEGSESRSDDDNKDDDESDEGEEENEEKIGGSDFEYIEDNQDNDEENNGETIRMTVRPEMTWKIVIKTRMKVKTHCTKIRTASVAFWR